MGRLPFPRMCAAVGITLSAVALRAQVSLTTADGKASLRNPMPVDAIALTYASSSKTFATLQIPAESAVDVDAAAKLTWFEPIAASVGWPEMFKSCGTAQVPRPDVQQVVKEIKGIDLLKTAGAKEKMAAASALAQLDLDTKLDTLATAMNDPLRLELRRQQERYESEGEKYWTRVDDAVHYVGSDVTARAFAWAEVQEEKLSILHDQLLTFEPLVQQARLAIQIRTDELATYGNIVASWHVFSSTVASAIDASEKGAGEAPLEVLGVKKICDGPSPDSDWIELEGPARDGVSTLIAEVSFDHGPKQLTYLRRLSTSNRWAGKVNWPAPSTNAELRVRWPGATRWARAKGTVVTARKSMDDMVSDARKAVSVIEKKMKESNFRAGGGDNIRTAPVF